MVWQAGHLLNNGKYEIIEVLGRGGFGLTYKARHRQLVMEVVIKTPDILQKRDTEYEDYVKQFEAEGRKLAKFSQTPHPHIVRVWDIFMEGQVPCLVMDFIQGQTLMEKVKAQRRLSEAECLKYIRQIGSALEAVHQAGMIHRDAHPGNIMIQPNGNAILIDFGIAKEIIPASSSSTDYAANPSFAPYEQIYRGSKANRQPSVDIYALAASFYYAVTGQKPTPSMERRLDNRPLKSPKEINPNLSEHLNKAITLGMALEKGDRPQSMSDWLQQLELPPPPVKPQYRQGKVNPPPFIKNPQVPVKKKQKKVPWGGLIGVFLVYGLVGCIVGLYAPPLNVWIWVVFCTVAVTGGVTFARERTVIGTVVGAMIFAGLMLIALRTAQQWSIVITAVVASGGITWLVNKTSIVHRWRDTARLNSIVSSILFVLPGLVGFITYSVVTYTYYVGVVFALIYTLVSSCTFLTLYNLNNKKFSHFNIFLILVVTNLSGLGYGGLLGFLLHPKG